MAAFIDQHLDCYLAELEGIFEDDSDGIGFEKLIAQVTYNDPFIVSPISSRCNSPIISEAVSSRCESSSTLTFSETSFLDIAESDRGAPLNLPSSDGVAPFQHFESPSSVFETNTGLLTPQIDTSFGQVTEKTKTRRAKMCHKVTPALSAYNFFFRDERDRILSGVSTYNWTRERQEMILKCHWQQDRSQKRRHVKTHGKINFATLSKSISLRWKQLPESCKDFYREISLRLGSLSKGEQ